MNNHSEFVLGSSRPHSCTCDTSATRLCADSGVEMIDRKQAANAISTSQS